MKLITVGDCARCPFHAADCDPWECTAARRGIPRDQYFEAGPPDWCPLRQTDHVVTLRVR